MKTVRGVVAALLLQWILAGTAGAATMGDILKQVQNLRDSEATQMAEREASFKRALAEQEAKAREAVATRNAEEARSEALSNEFDYNEKHIAELAVLLKQHEGNLGELFGVTRQVAGDSAGVLRESLITVQFPATTTGDEDREAFMRRLAGAKELPSIRELERLWFELMREMTESAKVVLFKAPVLNADGTSGQEAEVVRVGPFTAVTNGRYLAYLETEKALIRLNRQPPSSFRDIAQRLQAIRAVQHAGVGTIEGAREIARELQQAGGGYAPAIVDPARGALMSQFVDRPDFFERIQKGELVGYVIISVGIIGAVLWLFQLIYLFMTRLAMAWQLRNPNRPAESNPLGRVLMVFRDTLKRGEDSPEVVELRISEAVLKEVPKLERFQSFLRLAVAAGPLLGLIGTVVGMIITFQAITQSGSSDPKLMAHGIGQAMIATVLGLGIAIPLLFANASLAALSRRMVQLLDEQSTGLLAERTGQRKA
jgi:biopolymer transport protein ExbB